MAHHCSENYLQDQASNGTIDKFPIYSQCIVHFTIVDTTIWWPQTSNTIHTLVDHSDVVGASPVVTAPTTSSFSTSQLASMDWA